ncbi:hypothetical protein [Streptomyces sp. NPDC001269]
MTRVALTELLIQLRRVAVGGVVPEDVFEVQVSKLGLGDSERERLRGESARLCVPVRKSMVHANIDTPDVEKVASDREGNVSSWLDGARTLLGRADTDGYVTSRAYEGVIRLAGLDAREAVALRAAATVRAEEAAEEDAGAVEDEDRLTGEGAAQVREHVEEVWRDGQEGEPLFEPSQALVRTESDVAAAVVSAGSVLEEDRFRRRPEKYLLETVVHPQLTVLLGPPTAEAVVRAAWDRGTLDRPVISPLEVLQRVFGALKDAGCRPKHFFERPFDALVGVPPRAYLAARPLVSGVSRLAVRDAPREFMHAQAAKHGGALRPDGATISVDPRAEGESVSVVPVSLHIQARPALLGANAELRPVESAVNVDTPSERADTNTAPPSPSAPSPRGTDLILAEVRAEHEAVIARLKQDHERRLTEQRRVAEEQIKAARGMPSVSSTPWSRSCCNVWIEHWRDRSGISGVGSRSVSRGLGRGTARRSSLRRGARSRPQRQPRRLPQRSSASASMGATVVPATCPASGGGFRVRPGGIRE